MLRWPVDFGVHECQDRWPMCRKATDCLYRVPSVLRYVPVPGSCHPEHPDSMSASSKQTASRIEYSTKTVVPAMDFSAALEIESVPKSTTEKYLTVVNDSYLSKPTASDRRYSNSSSFKLRNPTVEFHGQKRSNETHTSTTTPETRLFRKRNYTAPIGPLWTRAGQEPISSAATCYLQTT